MASPLCRGADQDGARNRAIAGAGRPLRARPTAAVDGDSDDIARIADGAARSLAPVREVAQIGAVVGREFSYELLNAVAGLPIEKLEEALGQLVRSELVFAGARYPRRSTPSSTRLCETPPTPGC